MEISFIILFHNQWEITKQTIDTLIDSLEKSVLSHSEIIVVDNGSELEAYKALISIVHQYVLQKIPIRCLRLDENMGYPVGINFGLSKSQGQYIAVLNSDLIFTKGWLEPLLHALKEEPKRGLVGPYLSNATGEQHVGYTETDVSKIHQYSATFMKQLAQTLPTYRLIGACMVLKREVLDAVGGNDFWFGAGHFDDDDWCIRIRLAGYQLGLVKNSFVYHIGSGSFSKAKLDFQLCIYNNKQKFMTKWQLDTLEQVKELSLLKDQYSRAFNYIPLDQTIDTASFRMDGYLIVVDWLNKEVAWEKTIKELMKRCPEMHLYAWIPQQYFTCDVSDSSRLHWITDNIPHSELGNFIGGFKGVVRVANDFVNRYILSIAKTLDQIG